AGVARRALVAVVAGRALGCRGPLAHAQGAAPLDAPVAVLAGGAVLHGAAHATTLEALLVGRAGVAVVAGGSVGDDRPRAGAAHAVLVGRAGVAVVAGGTVGLRGAAGTQPGLAGIDAGAPVAVVAGGVVVLIRVRALPGGRIAGAGVVALFERGADDGVGAGARAALAGVGLGARVAVVAGGAVAVVRVGALAGGGVAGAGDVALVGGGADDGVRAGAGATLAGVALRAGVAVVARAAVAGVRVGALAGGGVAGAGVVALVERGADDGVVADAHPALAGARGARIVAYGARRLERTIGRAARRGGTVRWTVVTLLAGINYAVTTRDVADDDPDRIH